MRWRETLRAVKEQYWRSVAGFEHFKFDAGDGHGLSLQGRSPEVLCDHFNGSCVVGHASGRVRS
jgi:hypothetical protein